MFALAGVANAVYHPANYALLSHLVTPARIGRSFSMHTFSGLLGAAVAPPVLLGLAGLVGWRGGLIVSAAIGGAIAVLLVSQRDVLLLPMKAATNDRKDLHGEDPAAGGARLLLSAPIVRNLVFFFLLAIAHTGLQNYSVAALGALHGLSPAIANAGLSGFLSLGAIGVLVGGSVAVRTARHDLVAGITMAVTATAALLIATLSLAWGSIVFLMSVAGLFNGLTMPSRDMIVRAVTPPRAVREGLRVRDDRLQHRGHRRPDSLGYFMDKVVRQPQGIPAARMLHGERGTQTRG